jgi:pyridoxamine 5'-phosphate oxidase|nr:pyridoxamine 5'-phosphate oxidase [Kofleriaceae bacterium]
MADLSKVTSDYSGEPLDPADCIADPLVAIERWVAAAIAAKVPTPNAMTLATADERGRPSARIVLLKGVDARGLTFFTNYGSRKGRELAARPYAALVLFWEPMHRQIRVEGTVERVATSDSDAYFASRARGSQLGAIASPQSQPIASRAALEALVADVARKHGDGAGAALPRPAYWGGYRVVPELVELWQGQPSRLHDRVRYRLIDGAWVTDRLAP